MRSHEMAAESGGENQAILFDFSSGSKAHAGSIIYDDNQIPPNMPFMELWCVRLGRYFTSPCHSDVDLDLRHVRKDSQTWYEHVRLAYVPGSDPGGDEDSDQIPYWLDKTKMHTLTII